MTPAVFPGARRLARAMACIRVGLHWLVEIHGAACRHIEAGDPHRTDEYEPQRVVSIFELAIKVFLLRPLPMGQAIEFLLLEIVAPFMTGRSMLPFAYLSMSK